MKKILELKFCEPGVCVFSNKTKNGLRTQLKSFNHYFELIGGKQPFACLINAFTHLHIADKLGKGIN
jgi:hypothetical protein